MSNEKGPTTPIFTCKGEEGRLRRMLIRRTKNLKGLPINQEFELGSEITGAG